jgi:NAD(P)-dependent dehydrogenase (short-subunit alcohol dehydrogenase family)
MPDAAVLGAHTTALEVIDGVDLSGRFAIVTGGASGIGVETVRALLSAGADVTVAARNTTAASELASTLGAERDGASVHVLALDLTSLDSCRAAAATFVTRGVPLSILINNAGVMATPFERTADGNELQFGTNHLGHFAFTMGLLEPLRRAEGARVVSLSSVGHRRSDLVADDPNYRTRPYERWGAYGQSKTANALFAVGLSSRFGGDGIFSNAVMPGGILTGLQKHLSVDEQIELGWLDEAGTPNPRFKTPAQGASTSIWAAVAPELDGVGGRYLENCAVAAPMDPTAPYVGYMPYALDPDSAEVLWSLSETLTSPG